MAAVPPSDQFTTAITMGEMLYGAERRGSSQLSARVGELLASALTILPFDTLAAERYGSLRARLEAEGRRLHEPDLRIAAVVLSRNLTLVTGNVRHFDRVRGLSVENWLG